MKKIPVLLVLAACAAVGCQRTDTRPVKPPPTPTAASNPAPSRHPLLVLHERDPWAQVIGAEVPSFVLYDDGSAIYVEESSSGGRAMQAVLSNEERDRLAKTIFDELDGAPEQVSLSQLTDQPSVRIMARHAGNWRVVHIYGIDGDARPSGGPAAGALSAALESAYLELRRFSADGATPWKPERLEVLLSGFDYAKDVVPWPSDLPAPPKALRPSPDGYARRFVLPAKHGAALERLIGSLGDRRAVAFNGHAWSVNVRPVVPAQNEIQSLDR